MSDDLGRLRTRLHEDRAATARLMRDMREHIAERDRVIARLVLAVDRDEQVQIAREHLAWLQERVL